MEWTARYVGLPYRRFGRDRAGVDCWGLARLPLVELKGIALPLWDTVDPEDMQARCDAFETTRGDGSWLSVPESEAREFDFVRMNTLIEIDGRKYRRPVHIGLMAPRRHVLHIRRRDTSQLEPIDSLRRNITEFCRHRGLQ